MFLAAFILALGWLGNETYMHVKSAEMRTQVAMLTADIRYQLTENKMRLEDLNPRLISALPAAGLGRCARPRSRHLYD